MNTTKNFRYGQIIYNPNDARVGKHLTQYGEYAECQARLFKGIVRPDSWVVEIGAGYGQHTMLLALLVKEGVVVAIEPNRIPYYCLCGAVALNNHQNVYCRQEYISDQSGRKRMPERNPHAPQDFCDVSDIPEGTNTFTIKMKSLDEMHGHPVDLLKVSSGHAVEVIKGGKKFLERSKPFVYLSTDDLQLVMDDLRGLGYDLYAHMPREYNNDNCAKNQFNTIGNMAEQNLLCVHPGRKNKQEIFDILDKEQLDLCILDEVDAYEKVSISKTERLQLAKKNAEDALLNLASISSEHLYDHDNAAKLLKVAGEVELLASVAICRSRAAIATKQHKWEDAVRWLAEAINDASPEELHRLWVDYGVANYCQGCYQEAARAHEEAFKIRPSNEAAWHLAMSYLKVGNYEKGWPLYESRLKHPRSQMWLNAFPKAKYWDGETLTGGNGRGGKKILVLFNEQGTGDFIQMMRYVERIKQHYKEGLVYVAADPKLATLFGENNFPDTFIQCPGNVPFTYNNIDYVCSMFSLPRILGVPGPTDPYIMHIQSDEELEGINIGIVWAGSPTNENDHLRSCFLRDMESLTKIDANFHSLQMGEMKRTWPDQGKVNLILGSGNVNFASVTKFDSFADTAKCISALDYVVAVDTAVAHLAAAMGKPVYLALGLGADWRWGTDVTSEWYPSVKIYRRSTINTWEQVFEHIAGDLDNAIKKAN